MAVNKLSLPDHSYLERKRTASEKLALCPLPSVTMNTVTLLYKIVTDLKVATEQY